VTLKYIRKKNNFQYGVHLLYWVYCDVIILHPTAIFYVPDIVLNFCRLIWYFLIYVDFHFGLKLPVLGQSLAWWSYYIIFYFIVFIILYFYFIYFIFYLLYLLYYIILYSDPQKAHPCAISGPLSH